MVPAGRNTFVPDEDHKTVRSKRRMLLSLPCLVPGGTESRVGVADKPNPSGMRNSLSDRLIPPQIAVHERVGGMGDAVVVQQRLLVTGAEFDCVTRWVRRMFWLCATGWWLDSRPVPCRTEAVSRPWRSQNRRRR